MSNTTNNKKLSEISQDEILELIRMMNDIKTIIKDYCHVSEPHMPASLKNSINEFRNEIINELDRREDEEGEF